MIKQGLTYEEHEVGAKYETLGRTVTEADVCAFVNLCGFTESLFYDMEYVTTSSVFKGKPAPGAFTFCLSEGLVIQTGLIHGTGMSYLGSEIKIVAPVLVATPCASAWSSPTSARPRNPIGVSSRIATKS